MMRDLPEVVLSDLGRCRPSAALSQGESPNQWQRFPYRVCDGDGPPHDGVMIGAPSYVNAPELTLPLEVSGWHDIRIGIWTPAHDYDGATTVKVKLDDDSCFTRIDERASLPGQTQPRDCASLLREATFKAADLTGRHLVFAKINGNYARKAYVAYVRLTPLSPAAVRALQAERNCLDTRRMQATIDGISYLKHNAYQTRTDVLELVEPFRGTDVGKVTWAFSYGDSVNYPSRTGVYLAGERDPDTHSCRAGLRRLADAGCIPQVDVADQVHGMGLKFEAMFRLGMFGRVPPRRWWPPNARGFVETHPQFRLCMPDGSPVQKASYAFPEVREHMLAIIRESAEQFDIDSVALAFNRGPRLTAYEQPVLDDFKTRYGGDARALPLDDPRLQAIRCRYLTQFVREVRTLLDDVGAAKRKRIELSAWTTSHTPATRALNGEDIETWIREGWIDSLVGMIGESGIDPAVIAAANAHGCKCLPALMCSGGGHVHGPGGNLLAKAGRNLYPPGADGVALWDADTVTSTPLWPILRRMGHPDAAMHLAEKPIERPLLALKEVAGCNMETEHGRFGLAEAAYTSG